MLSAVEKENLALETWTLNETSVSKTVIKYIYTLNSGVNILTY